MQRDAVHDRGHAEFADAVVDVAAAVGRQLHRRHALPVGVVAGREVSRAAEQFGQLRDIGRDGCGRSLARADRLLLLGAGGQQLVDCGRPGRRPVALDPAQQFGRFGRERLAIGRELVVPGLLAGGAGGLRIPCGIDVPGDRERGFGPAEFLSRQRDLFGAERLAVGLGGAGSVGRAPSDDRAADDQRRPLFAGRLRQRLVDGGVDGLDVVTVDAFLAPDHVPAVGPEAGGGVVGEPALDLAVDRDAVVVVERDQLAEFPRAGERRGLMREAFHHAAVAHEDEGAVVDDLVIGFVEFFGEQLLGQRHADRVREALAERTGGGFDARRDAELRVTGCLRMELTKTFQLLHRQVVAGEVQQRVLQHRAVAVRQDEAVAVDPQRIDRVVAQVVLPQRHGDVGHAHRHAGVTRLGLLDRVHRQCANRVGHPGR